jgi:UPF0755 protein
MARSRTRTRPSPRSSPAGGPGPSAEGRAPESARGASSKSGAHASDPPSPPSSARPNRKHRPRRKKGSAASAHRPERRSRLRTLALVAAGALGVVALALGSLVAGYGRMPQPAPAARAAVELELPPGLDANAVAERLAAAGLVRSESLLAWYLRTTGGGYAAGAHLLRPGSSPAELASMLRRDAGRPRVRVTIPEGYHLFDLGRRLEREGVTSRGAWLAAATDGATLDELGVPPAKPGAPRSAEGYLFPATYELALDSDPAEVLRTLAREADRRWASVAASHASGLASLEASLGWGRHEVLTLASLVEKETAAADERPLVASVFLNRLLDPSFVPKRLQSDPTGVYGCLLEPERIPACATFTGKATPELLRDPENRFSTYVAIGLPPGPIANPGVPSIEAVLAPATTKYLYFVAKGAGRHTFSETLDAHNEAVRKLREARP